MSISELEHKQLRGKAHALKPVVLIGQYGLKDSVIEEIELALNFHQLIKIKVSSADREERKEIIQELQAKLTFDLIQTIGSVAVLYRRNPKKPPVLS